MCFHSKQPKVFLQLVALVGNGLRGENGNDLRDWEAVTGQQLCHRDYDQPPLGQKTATNVKSRQQLEF